MDDDYYKSQGGVVPVKWTAPEVRISSLYKCTIRGHSQGNNPIQSELNAHPLSVLFLALSCPYVAVEFVLSVI